MIIDSYLVALGYELKAGELQKFTNFLKQAETAVHKHTDGIAKDLFKIQIGLTSTFLAVGTAVVALADKVAMADQTWRLMGLHMFTTKETARSFDIALKALGATIDDVAWDQELHGRFVKLIDDQRIMSKELGGNFDQTMRSIRDIRFEWSRFEVELQYLSFSVINDLFKQLGFGSGTFLEKLQKFNDWIRDNLPTITSAINSVLVPALKDLREILGDVGSIGKEAWITFQQIIGVLNNDSSLDGTNVSLQTISTTLKHVTEDAHQFLLIMLDLEKALAHFVLAMVDVGTGNFKAAASQLAQAVSSVADVGQHINPATGAALGALGGAGLGASGGAVAGGALGSVFGPIGTLAGATIGGFLGGTGGAVAGGVTGEYLGQFGGGGGDPVARLSAAAESIAKMTGLDPALVFGQLWHETNKGTNRGARDLHNLAGIKDSSGKDYRNFASDDEFDSTMARILNRDFAGQTPHSADEYASILKRQKYYENSESVYASGISSGASKYQPTGGIGDITVNVHVAGTNATPQDIADAQQKALRETLYSHNVAMQAKLAGVY